MQLKRFKSRGLPLTKILYISCESPTETQYFNSIKQRIIDLGLTRIISIKPFEANHSDCLHVVEKAEWIYYTKINQQEENQIIYCVFDKDDNPDVNIRQAKKRAKEIKAEIIFSNPCYEVWLLLHFQNTLSNISADRLKDILKDNNHFACDFKAASANNFLKIKHNTNIAVSGAKRISKESDKYLDTGNPHTDVFKILEGIKEIIGDEKFNQVFV